MKGETCDVTITVDFPDGRSYELIAPLEQVSLTGYRDVHRTPGRSTMIVEDMGTTWTLHAEGDAIFDPVAEKERS